MTVREALNLGAKALKRHRCAGADPVREAEALLMHALGATREELLTSPDRPLSAARARRFSTLLRRRASHEPLAHLLGTAWFRGREFLSSPAALIPRPATEHVVDAAIEAASAAVRPVFIDVGTGSGCIAISLALETPASDIMATDASAAALRLARANARRFGVSTRISFLKTDLLPKSLPLYHFTSSDLVIVANLPYIPSGKMRGLDPCVRREPRAALAGGKDGLLLYRELLARLRAIRPTGGLTLICEILPGQFARLRREITKTFPAAGTDRVRNGAGVTVGLVARLRKADASG